MRGLLFGLQIPDAATHVTVRPILGQGNRRALYRGPVDQDGVVLSDDDIKDTVARDARFWDYVDASIKSGSLSETDKRSLRCRVSVQFLDSGGAALSLGDGGELWAQSTETVEFLRSRAREPGRTRKPDGAVAVGRAVAAVAPALERMAASLVRETTAQVKAALELSERLADKLEKQLERESSRVDSAIEQNATIANTARQSAGTPGSPGSGLGSFGDLLRVASEAKKLLLN